MERQRIVVDIVDRVHQIIEKISEHPSIIRRKSCKYVLTFHFQDFISHNPSPDKVVSGKDWLEKLHIHAESFRIPADLVRVLEACFVVYHHYNGERSSQRCGLHLSVILHELLKERGVEESVVLALGRDKFKHFWPFFSMHSGGNDSDPVTRDLVALSFYVTLLERNCAGYWPQDCSDTSEPQIKVTNTCPLPASKPSLFRHGNIKIGVVSILILSALLAIAPVRRSLIETFRGPEQSETIDSSGKTGEF